MREPAERLGSGDYRGLVDVLESLVAEHSSWISDSCLNLVSAHNAISPRVSAMLSSGLADKFNAGRIGRRDHAGSRYIDEIEEISIAAAQRLFRAKHVEYRPMSGTISNAVSIFALTEPGDQVLAWPRKYGGHFTFQNEGYPKHGEIHITDIPCAGDADYGRVDFDAYVEALQKKKPSLVILGTSTALFPFPLEQLARAAREVDARVMYDGAHVMGLIAGHAFQDPLREGADLVSGSTQKTMPGPIGGLVLSNADEVASAVESTADKLITNYQNNRVAALTVAMLELLEFGEPLAQAIIANAKSLARSLSDQGLLVLCPERGFTDSHQLIVDAYSIDGATEAVKRLEEANILSTRIPIPRDYPDGVDSPSGLRFGTNEVTRFGMGPKEMETIAELIALTILKKEDPRAIRKAVLDLKWEFPDMKFTFDTPVG